MCTRWLEHNACCCSVCSVCFVCNNDMQCRSVITPNPHTIHAHPIARPILLVHTDFYSASVIALKYTMSCYTGARYSTAFLLNSRYYGFYLYELEHTFSTVTNCITTAIRSSIKELIEVALCPSVTCCSWFIPCNTTLMVVLSKAS